MSGPNFICSRGHREPEEPVELAVTRFIRETAAAHMVLLEDTGEEVWFPKSQVESVEKMDDGTGLLTVSRWIANAKGLTD